MAAAPPPLPPSKPLGEYTADDLKVAGSERLPDGVDGNDLLALFYDPYGSIAPRERVLQSLATVLGKPDKARFGRGLQQIAEAFAGPATARSDRLVLCSGFA
jgi:hypothetical protein